MSSNAYLWIKAFHVIFMVAWFAGLFYIFRLFVYHVKFRQEPKLCEAYQLMERKLLFRICHPAMFFTILFGGLLLHLNPAWMHAAWLKWKLLCVAGIIAYQVFAGITFRKFKKGDFFLSEAACRVINEVPAVLLILIVLLVILKPFAA